MEPACATARHCYIPGWLGQGMSAGALSQALDHIPAHIDTVLIAPPQPAAALGDIVEKSDYRGDIYLLLDIRDNMEHNREQLQYFRRNLPYVRRAVLGLKPLSGQRCNAQVLQYVYQLGKSFCDVSRLCLLESEAGFLHYHLFSWFYGQCMLALPQTAAGELTAAAHETLTLLHCLELLAADHFDLLLYGGLSDIQAQQDYHSLLYSFGGPVRLFLPHARPLHSCSSPDILSSVAYPPSISVLHHTLPRQGAAGDAADYCLRLVGIVTGYAPAAHGVALYYHYGDGYWHRPHNRQLLPLDAGGLWSATFSNPQRAAIPKAFAAFVLPRAEHEQIPEQYQHTKNVALAATEYRI